MTRGADARASASAVGAARRTLGLDEEEPTESVRRLSGTVASVEALAASADPAAVATNAPVLEPEGGISCGRPRRAGERVERRDRRCVRRARRVRHGALRRAPAVAATPGAASSPGRFGSPAAPCGSSPCPRRCARRRSRAPSRTARSARGARLSWLLRSSRGSSRSWSRLSCRTPRTSPSAEWRAKTPKTPKAPKTRTGPSPPSRRWPRWRAHCPPGRGGPRWTRSPRGCSRGACSALCSGSPPPRWTMPRRKPRRSSRRRGLARRRRARARSAAWAATHGASRRRASFSARRLR